MGTFDTNKTINAFGTIRNNGNTDIVDTYGTIRGSVQFDSFKVVDIFGNLGKILVTGQWEMQSGTVETISNDQGHITNNYAANAANPTLSSFLSQAVTGYIDGVISSNGVWTIQAGPQTIGGVSYPGNGLLIATGANTHTGTINMQAGTNLQLGADCTNTRTKAGGNLTIGAGATCTQYTSYTATTFLCQALTSTGIYNVIGCGVCGAGGLGRANTVANNGVINIDKAYWGHQSTFSGTGTINVKDGGTLQLSLTTIGSTQTANINGCGWCDATGVTLGALYMSATGVSYAMKINVQTPSCIKLATNVNSTLSGVISGSAALNVSGMGTPKPNGIVHISNTANTYSGTITVDGVSLVGSYSTSMQFAKIVLANGGRISSTATQTIGSLASSDPTTYWSSADFLNHYIKANGVTTYAGRLLWNGGSNTANFWLEGGSSNVLTMTGTGNTGNIYPRNGAKLILQGATWTGANGQVRVSAGSTVSAGTSTTGGAVLIYIDATSALDVYASGSSTGIINTGTGTSSLSAGWKVNLLDPLPAGTHVIWKNTGAAITSLPAIGTNLSGRTVTGFAWNNTVNPKTLSVTLV